jgi:hypothetical protein
MASWYTNLLHCMKSGLMRKADVKGRRICSGNVVKMRIS